MSGTKKEYAEEVALFRFGLIAELLHIERGSREMGAAVRAKSEKQYTLPHSRGRQRVAAETIRHWLKLYRRGGLEALQPNVRVDKGVARKMPRELADWMCAQKDERGELSVKQIIAEARKIGIAPPDLPLAVSTVHRLFERAGLMQATAPAPKDRRRFSFEHAGDLWMSDVMHGPTVGIGDGRSVRKSYLIGFIDDATRVVPFARFCFSENSASFLPCLREAVMRRGIPKRLYVDNGSAFRSHQLELVCAKLGITLIHAKPYSPQGKGKQERWFRTVRMQFLPILQDADRKSLAAINARLMGWTEGEYHRTPHKGLDLLTPADAWVQRSENIEHVGHRTDISDIFLFEQKRKVLSDRTVSLQGVIFEVDAILVGTTVTLRFEGDKAPPTVLQVFDATNVRHADATPVRIYENSRVKRQGSKPLPTMNFRDLSDTQEKDL